MADGGQNLTGGGYQITEDDVNGGLAALERSMGVEAAKIEEVNKLGGEVPPVGTFILNPSNFGAQAAGGGGEYVAQYGGYPGVGATLPELSTPGGRGTVVPGIGQVGQAQTAPQTPAGSRRADVRKGQLRPEDTIPADTSRKGWVSRKVQRDTEFKNDLNKWLSSYDSYNTNYQVTGIKDYSKLEPEITYEQIEFAVNNAKRLGTEPVTAIELMNLYGYVRNPDGSGLVHPGGKYDENSGTWLEKPKTPDQVARGAGAYGNVNPEAAARGVYRDETGHQKWGRSYVQVSEQGGIYAFRKSKKSGKWIARKARSKGDYGRLARRRAFRYSRGLTAWQQRKAQQEQALPGGGAPTTVLELRAASG